MGFVARPFGHLFETLSEGHLEKRIRIPYLLRLSGAPIDRFLVNCGCVFLTFAAVAGKYWKQSFLGVGLCKTLDLKFSEAHKVIHFDMLSSEPFLDRWEQRKFYAKQGRGSIL